MDGSFHRVAGSLHPRKIPRVDNDYDGTTSKRPRIFDFGSERLGKESLVAQLSFSAFSNKSSSACPESSTAYPGMWSQSTPRRVSLSSVQQEPEQHNDSIGLILESPQQRFPEEGDGLFESSSPFANGNSYYTEEIAPPANIFFPTHRFMGQSDGASFSTLSSARLLRGSCSNMLSPASPRSLSGSLRPWIDRRTQNDAISANGSKFSWSNQVQTRRPALFHQSMFESLPPPPFATSPNSSFRLRDDDTLFGIGSQQKVLYEAAAANPRDLRVILALPGDRLKLSPHQVFLRYQIEAFRATEEDITTHTRGRNKKVKLGQVGIRCRHCAHLPVMMKQKGSVYFPATLLGIYQAAQNMSTTHLQCGLCSQAPLAVKGRFIALMSTRAFSSGAGRPYWAEGARKLGLVDTEDGIRFLRDLETNGVDECTSSSRLALDSKSR